MKKHLMEQRSSEWFQKRKGKISGTVLKALMGTPKARQEAIYEIIAQRLTVGVEEDYENPMARGIRLEPEAIAAFEFATSKTVETVGFCESDDNEQIGYSSDGLIADTNDSEDLEIKCMGGKNHVKMWLEDEVPKDYYWQLVQAFVVNPKLKRRYFVGYNPDLPRHPLHIIEVERKDVEADIVKAQKEQEEFLNEVTKLLENIIKL